MAVKDIIVAKIGYGNLLAIGVVSSMISSFEKQPPDYLYPGILFTAKNQEGKDVVVFVLMEEENIFCVIWTLVFSGVYLRKEGLTSEDLGKAIRDIFGK